MCLNQTIWVSIYFLFMRIISKNIKYHRNTLIFFFNSIFHELVWLYNLIEIHRLFQSYCESHVVWCNIIRQAFVEVKKNEGYDRTSHYKLFPMCLYITNYIRLISMSTFRHFSYTRLYKYDNHFPCSETKAAELYIEVCPLSHGLHTHCFYVQTLNLWKERIQALF